MKIEITEYNYFQIAEIISSEIEIRKKQDPVDILANCMYCGVAKIIIQGIYLVPDSFNLKTGISAEILQKFSTYNAQFAIVSDFTKYLGKSLKDFIYESNKYKRIIFVSSIDEAKNIFAK